MIISIQFAILHHGIRFRLAGNEGHLGKFDDLSTNIGHDNRSDEFEKREVAIKSGGLTASSASRGALQMRAESKRYTPWEWSF